MNNDMIQRSEYFVLSDVKQRGLFHNTVNCMARMAMDNTTVVHIAA